MSHLTPPENGTCQTDPYARELFQSPLLEPFDTATYKEEQESYTAESVLIAKTMHNSLAANKIDEAKQVCFACPVLEACKTWVEGMTAPVYGVTAGTTERDRWQAKGSPTKGIYKTVSSRSALNSLGNTSDEDILSMLLEDNTQINDEEY